jgi:hypothetical protein
MINWVAKSETGNPQKVLGLTGAHKRITLRSTMTLDTKNISQARRDATTEDMRPQTTGHMTRTIERPQVAGRSAGPVLPNHQ